MKLQSTSQNNNTFVFKISFSEPFTLTNSSNNKVMKFVNSVDVSKPGSPSLPSKIVYVAIPPESKANISLINQQYQMYSGSSVEINPSVNKLNDSTLKYKNENLRKEYFQSDQYPQSECNIKGYIWIRNYYCAVIEI